MSVVIACAETASNEVLVGANMTREMRLVILVVNPRNAMRRRATLEV
jgi:hypothetical protein